jgi:hypothetical protein
MHIGAIFQGGRDINLVHPLLRSVTIRFNKATRHRDGEVDLGIPFLTEGHARPYVPGMRDRRIWRSHLIPPPTTLGSDLTDR